MQELQGPLRALILAPSRLSFSFAFPVSLSVTGVTGVISLGSCHLQKRFCKILQNGFNRYAPGSLHSVGWPNLRSFPWPLGTSEFLAIHLRFALLVITCLLCRGEGRETSTP